MARFGGKNRRARRDALPPHTLYRITATGDTIALEWLRCSRCHQYIPDEEVDLDVDVDEAWIDGDNYICRRCR